MNEAVVDTSLVEERSSVKEKMYFGIKRAFDICVSLVGMLFLIPSVIFVKLAYLLSGDFHTIFYSQKRIGKDGKEFKFYKFRSMLVDSEGILENTLKMDPIAADEYKRTKKLKNDPRITKVGRFIRKTSIDELPQLINIFKGDMSLIGNRPYLPREKEDMGPFYNSIIKTKPGLTGYWQVNGRSNTTFAKRLELESYYSNHCGLRMDIKIFFKTFTAVLFHKGAE
ncbi:MAG: sugar transferase [Bacilli bacterium]|nr:sugar transferase [Bacilli bacterium]